MKESVQSTRKLGVNGSEKKVQSVHREPKMTCVPKLQEGQYEGIHNDQEQ